LDVANTPLFPFGFGLSYTQFRLQNLQVNKKQIRANENINVSIEVENTGKRAGAEVVQMYLRDMAASVTRPVKELRGFERINLQPGEKRLVNFTLKPEHLGFLDRTMKFIVEPGVFQVFVGSNSESGITTQFEVVK
jgi:beta-glucosidase